MFSFLKKIFLWPYHEKGKKNKTELPYPPFVEAVYLSAPRTPDNGFIMGAVVDTEKHGQYIRRWLSSLESVPARVDWLAGEWYIHENGHDLKGAVVALVKEGTTMEDIREWINKSFPE